MQYSTVCTFPAHRLQLQSAEPELDTKLQVCILIIIAIIVNPSLPVNALLLFADKGRVTTCIPMRAASQQ